MPKKKLVLRLNEPYITRDGSTVTLSRIDGEQFIGHVKLNPEEYMSVITAVISRWNDDGSNVYNTEFDILS